jgi:hypothetical protein
VGLPSQQRGARDSRECSVVRSLCERPKDDSLRNSAKSVSDPPLPELLRMSVRTSTIGFFRYEKLTSQHVPESGSPPSMIATTPSAQSIP